MTPVIAGLLLIWDEGIAAKTATLRDGSVCFPMHHCSLWNEASTCLSTTHQTLHSPTSPFFSDTKKPVTYHFLLGISFLQHFQVSVEISFLPRYFYWNIPPNTESGMGCLARCFTAVASDSTLYVRLGRELPYPTHLVLPGNWSRQSSIEVQFTIILVVSKFKDGTTKAIKWIRSNLKKN